MHAEFIRSLEQHRALTLAHPTVPLPQLPLPILTSWIFHDNMVEGHRFTPTEIHQALTGDDQDLDRYLHPLMSRIRRYRDTVEFVRVQAARGQDGVTLDNLKAIHKRLTPNSADRGGFYRRTSPVHRDYYQKICGADKVPYHLRRLFEQIDAEWETTMHPVAFAAEMHRTLMHIYPFRRNPGTAARLFTDLLLMSRGYPPVIIPAQLRPEYYAALASPSSDDLIRIFQGSVQGFMDAMARIRAVTPADGAPITA
ncbi:MAG: Fic family protein [Bradymonadia bacterium]